MAVVTYGMDVSHNNGVIDWDQVMAFANPKLDYVYIKATQGVNYTDPQLKANAAGAGRIGLKFGFYHFASLNNYDVVSDSTAEAMYFSSVLKSLPKASLLPVLDIETNDSMLSPDEVQLWMQTFFDVMARQGFPQVMIYSYGPFLNQNLPSNHPFGKMPLWIANWTSFLTPSLPHGWNSYVLWQYSDHGNVPGVGKVDMDKSTPDLMALAKAGGISLGIAAIGLALFFLAVEGIRYVKRKNKE